MIKFENGTYFSYDMIGEFHSSGEWIHPKRKIESYEIILVLEGTESIATPTLIINSVKRLYANAPQADIALHPIG